MVSKVEPLSSKLSHLEQESEKTKAKHFELQAKIADLELRIQKLKAEYAELISATGEIKKELEIVQLKVSRSTQLLSSLRVECDRWEQGRDGFSQQMETLAGDVLLSAAFLAYSGYFDQRLREVLFQKWMDMLLLAQVIYRHELARIEYLSSADERLQWQSNGMSKDDLSMENVIMMSRFNRYPLIIDPSGQSLNFLMNQFSCHNIQKTSFLDNNFR